MLLVSTSPLSVPVLSYPRRGDLRASPRTLGGGIAQHFPLSENVSRLPSKMTYLAVDRLLCSARNDRAIIRPLDGMQPQEPSS